MERSLLDSSGGIESDASYVPTHLREAGLGGK
jgi:hypothetical protein